MTFQFTRAGSDLSHGNHVSSKGHTAVDREMDRLRTLTRPIRPWWPFGGACERWYFLCPLRRLYPGVLVSVYHLTPVYWWPNVTLVKTHREEARLSHAGSRGPLTIDF